MYRIKNQRFLYFKISIFLSISTPERHATPNIHSSNPPSTFIAHMYLFSGSNLSIKSILFSYIVNTIPPLNINLASLGTAPLQSVKNPSFFTIVAAHAKLFLYKCLASILCILVLTVSSGCVAYTVINPAIPPIPKVEIAPSFSPGAV